MYISDGGAPPPPFLFTTADPDYLLADTTEYPVIDTTDTAFPTTAMPYWEITEPDISQLLFLPPLINFGKRFESNRGQPSLNRGQPSVIEHQSSGRGQASVPEETRVGVHTVLDIDMFIAKQQQKMPGLLIPHLKQNSQNMSQCHPFPFCGEEGCSGIGLSLFVSFELLLLVLIVAANIAIISVIRDLNNNTKNRQYRSNNVFKLSLAVADLCLGLSLLPAGIQQSISALIDANFDIVSAQLHSIGSIPGIIFGSGAVMATIVGIWSILFIQIDLFMRIRWPMEQHCGKLLTTKRARIITVVIWCLSVGITVALWPLGFSFAINPATLTYSPILLPTLESDEMLTGTVNNSVLTVSEDRFKIPLYACLVWGLPFILTLPLGAYLVHAIGKACKKLRHRTQASYIKRHPEHVQARTRVRKDWEAACRTMIVELVYVVTFLPTIIAHIVFWKHDGCDQTASIFHFCAQFILIVGSFLNLFIYHLMWKDFQVRLRSLFCGQNTQSPDKKTALSSQASTTHSVLRTASEVHYPIRVISVTTDSPLRK